ncbi:tRNA dimethylallyltransferase, mitochondrial [Papilio xuthus]|uniref:tRNA dimethylallyltransferase, mitochondrial n=1 Tax=Papilio xuthus TaxID=66420 RepID=A0A194Q9E8_PAPXU|nr:tRNA dimethylallyltransferase, mitochondrial [Papilio xuthus]
MAMREQRGLVGMLPFGERIPDNYRAFPEARSMPKAFPSKKKLKKQRTFRLQTIHDERLNARVDSMLKEGLIQELLNFHDRHNKQRIKDDKPPDYTKGVFQTLGLKEFHEYLMMTEDERNSEDGKKLMLQSIDNMKIATRRYARRQNKMVKGRFLEIPTREVPTIYELDTTDLSQWDKQVKNKAIEIIESYINKIPCPYEPLKKNIDEEKKKINSQSSNYCDVCERLIIGDKEYTIHLNSFKHQRVLKKKKRLLDQKTKEVQNNS